LSATVEITFLVWCCLLVLLVAVLILTPTPAVAAAQAIAEPFVMFAPLLK
jgi:hypothetical protein